MDIAASSQQIMTSEKLISESFYVRLLRNYPHMQKYFTNTDMAHQAVVLRFALTMLEQFYRFQYPALLDYLHVIGHRHRVMGIPEDAYPDWQDCLLKTLAEFHGEHWNDTLHQQWTEASGLAIQAILEGYSLESGSI